MTGRYASQPPLPATPGAEGIGRVVKVGAAVKDLKPGDRIISLQRENWTQRRRIPADQAIKVRDDIALEQAAMLREFGCPEAQGFLYGEPVAPDSGGVGSAKVTSIKRGTSAA